MRYNYKQLYAKNANFYNAHPTAKKILLVLNVALSGLFFFGYFYLLFFAFTEELHTYDQVGIFAVPALCLFLVFILRMAIGRPRPYSADGAGIEPLLHKKHRDRESFPSRHVACAFVIAFAFVSYLPLAGGVLFALGAPLAYVRFALGLHYPSDLFGGAILGSLCGILFFL